MTPCTLLGDKYFSPQGSLELRRSAVTAFSAAAADDDHCIGTCKRMGLFLSNPYSRLFIETARVLERVLVLVVGPPVGYVREGLPKPQLPVAYSKRMSFTCIANLLLFRSLDMELWGKAVCGL